MSFLDSIYDSLPTMREFERCLAFWMLFWPLYHIEQHVKGVEKMLAEERGDHRLEEPHEPAWQSFPSGGVMLRLDGELFQLLPAARGDAKDVAAAVRGDLDAQKARRVEVVLVGRDGGANVHGREDVPDATGPRGEQAKNLDGCTVHTNIVTESAPQRQADNSKQEEP